MVDGNGVLACIILEHSRKEGLSEVESRNPEDIGSMAILYPILKELESIVIVTINSCIETGTGLLAS